MTAAMNLPRKLPVSLNRGDWLVLLLALMLLLLFYWQYWSSGVYGAQAAIYVDGKFWSKINLYQSQIIEVPGKLGISHLRVEKGRVRFVDSPCTGKQCIYQGWISNGGESATCLPNGVSVQVLSSDPRYDSINF
jgi:hypothetical protein